MVYAEKVRQEIIIQDSDLWTIL